jgi:hypothetical protein
MLARLNLHPDTPCAAVEGIDVAVERSAAGLLSLAFRVAGRVDALRIPEFTSPVRTDGLWQTTCFECFVHGPGQGYREYNLSPSTAWAAYAFDAHRAGMRELPAATPRIETRSGLRLFELDALLDLSDLPQDRPLRLGLSAVIEEVDGTHNYWALAHPPGRPDFHHEDCFALLLSPAE